MKKNALFKDFLMEIKNTYTRFLSIFVIVALGVAFFSGIRAASPDMNLSADAFYDRQNLMDIRILGTLGLTQEDVSAISDIEGIAAAQGGYSYDVLCGTEDTQPAVRLMSLYDNINEVTLTQGRMPKNTGECVADEKFLANNGYQVGDTVILKGDKEEEIKDIIEKERLTIVGAGSIPQYLSLDRGTTNVGNGQLDSFLLLPRESFVLDAYTEICIKVDGAKSMLYSTREYEELIEKITDRLEKISDGRCEIRYLSVQEEGTEELQDARKELTDAKQELADAQEKLEEGERQIRDGWKEIRDNESKLADAKKAIDKSKGQVADGQQQINDGYAALEEGQKELALRNTQIAEGKEQIAAARAEIETGKEQLAAGEEQLAAAQNELQAKEQTAAESKATIEEQLNQIPVLEQTKQELEQNQTDLKQQLAQTEGQLALIEEQLAQLEEQKDSMEPSAYEEALNSLLVQKAQTEEVREQITSGLVRTETSLAEVSQSLEALQSSEPALREALQKILDGGPVIAEAKNELAQQKAVLERKRTELEAGEAVLLQQEAEMAAGEQALETGEREIRENEALLAEKSQELEEGRVQLSQGIREYEDGIAKLADAKKTLEEEETKLEEGKEDFLEEKPEAEKKIADAETEIADAQEELDSMEVPQWYILDRNTIMTYVEYAQNSERIEAIGKVFPVIFFLVAALICLTTMTRMVEEQRIQIGTMKALGYGNGAIIFKYISYAFTASLLGSLVGLAAGQKLLPVVIIQAYGIMYNNLPDILAPLHLRYSLSSTAVAICCTTAATVFSCYRELMQPPAALMRPEAPKAGKRVFLERIGILWNHLNFTNKSTIRNLFRYKKRFFMTVLGIGGCMGILLVGFGIKDSIRAIGDLQFGSIRIYDGEITLDEESSGKERQDILKKAEEDDRIVSHLPVYETSLDISTEDGRVTKSAYMAVPSQEKQLSDYISLRDRISQETYELDENGIIITEKLAKLLGVEESDTVLLKEDETTQVPVVISHITENYFYHYIYMSSTLYAKLYGQEPEYLKIYTVNKDDAPAFETDIRDSYMAYDQVTEVAFLTTAAEDISDMLKSMDTIIYVIVLAAGMLAFVVLYNLNNINISERKRELATLKVLGFYDIEVSSYVFRENLLLTAFGSIAGIFFGILLHRFVIVTAEIDLMMFGRDITWKSYVYSVALTFLFSVLVNFVMHFRLKRINMVESLKSVE